MSLRRARIIIVVLITGASGLLSGCGTIVHLGGREDLTIASEPSGAKVVVDGAERGVTPLTVNLERKQPHRVLVSKEGYEESQSPVASKLSWWIAGNVVFGGIIGFLVDALSGGGYTIEPDKLTITLQPVSGQPTETPANLSSINPSPPVP
jgi:hypothetical protein